MCVTVFFFRLDGLSSWRLKAEQKKTEINVTKPAKGC